MVNAMSSRIRYPPRSAVAPNAGAMSATTRLATPLVTPRRNVLSVAATPAFQYCLKNTGKNPAMIVVANAEFAQSYSAQATTGVRVSPLRRAGEVFTGLPERDVRPPLHGELQID